jgi:ABC-2 type transport system permease protein
VSETVSTAVEDPRWRRGRLASYAKTFIGLLSRDVRVLYRQLPFVALRTVANPLLFVLVFTYVFPRAGLGFSGGPGGASFGTLLVPGLVAVAVFFAGVTAVALPLALELQNSGEIEDRVMAPVPLGLVALEKVVFSAVQSLVSAAVVFPVVYVVPTDPVSVEVRSWPLLVGLLVLASLASGALGLFLGTVVNPRQVGLFFGVVITPLIFLGCVYYPWAVLGDLRWLQILALANPLVYVSEGLRAALTPDIPHMPPSVSLLALTVVLLILSYLGVRGFVRRVVG